MPTAVPPPIAATSGTLGVRHVFCLIGLPERGKPFIARRLEAYLSFFHGAEVMLFDLSAYQARTGCPDGSDENANLLLEDLRRFMEGSSSTAAHNMTVKAPPGVPRASSFCDSPHRPNAGRGHRRGSSGGTSGQPPPIPESRSADAALPGAGGEKAAPVDSIAYHVVAHVNCRLEHVCT